MGVVFVIWNFYCKISWLISLYFSNELAFLSILQDTRGFGTLQHSSLITRMTTDKTFVSIPAAIKPYENKIRSLVYEWLYSVNKYGKLDYHKTDHHPSSVSCGDMPENLAAVTHNHPSNSPFPQTNLATAVRQNVEEMRVASKYYDYYIRSKDGDWGYHKTGYKSRERYGEAIAYKYNKTVQALDGKYYKIFNAGVEKRIKAIPGTTKEFQLE